MNIKAIQLLNFGRLETDEEFKEPAEDSPSGYFLRPGRISFLDRINKLKGEEGLKFGIQYFIEGYTDSTEPVEFVCKISHPTLVNPETGTTINETIDHKINYLNHNDFDYYSFEYDWETIKGTWTFEIIEQKRVLLKKAFVIE
ncbi:hypothetical protein GCM10027443_31120 [Pontibacter brevis]